MRPYSEDLRERVIAAIERGDCSQAQAAEQFRVGLRTVERWVHLKRATGSLTAKPHAGGAVRKLASVSDQIVVEVKHQPDATLAELCQRVAQARGVTSTPSLMCRELQRLALVLKKSRFTPVSVTPRG
jgi:transposase